MGKNKKVSNKRFLLLLILLAIIAITAFFAYKSYKARQTITKPVTPVQVVDSLFINEAVKKATANADNHVYGGYPIPKKNQNVKILKNRAYTVGYCEKRKNPLWVGYRYDEKKGKNHLKRPSGFKTDSRTDSKVKTSVYTKSGYDRGHLAPNAGIAFRFGEKAQLETFLMTNIVPQTPILNRQVWKRVEDVESELANKFENVWVITGPIFDDDVKLLKDTVEIPDAFYKIIIDEEKDRIRTISFIMDQDVTGKEPIKEFFATIDEIEERSGFDFLAPLDDVYEESLEKLLPEMIWK
ncbi:MAG: DNA/RNA non-specific endonuclease [Candidatus Riflebacteria bacterium]|nr:DNA/RNA non-specific endonuclease [Candidatus Riflebacteria bacterium]